LQNREFDTAGQDIETRFFCFQEAQTMRKLWFRPRSFIVTLVYFNTVESRTKDHVDCLVAFFLCRYWTPKARALEADVLRAITRTRAYRPDFVSRQREIDKKVMAWLLSKDEDRQDAAKRYHTQFLPTPEGQRP
jgi:hypothetical protein